MLCCVRSLPGSVAERQLLESFSRMLPELLRFSSASHLLSKISEDMQAHHRIANPSRVVPANAEAAVSVPSRALGRAGRLLQQHANTDRPMSPPSAKERPGIWDGWSHAKPTAGVNPFDPSDDEAEEDLDLNALGL